MENEVEKIHIKLHRSRLAIYLIIGFLSFLTCILIVLARQLSTDQALQTKSKAAYEIKAEKFVDVEYPLDLTAETQPLAILSPTPTPWLYETPGLPTPRPKVRPSPEEDYACTNTYLPKYPCVLGYNARDPYGSPDGCFQRYRPKCRLGYTDNEGTRWTNEEDKSQRPIPARYQAYCKYVPGEGTVCQLPGEMCIVPNACYEEQWQFAAEICGCYRLPPLVVVTQSPAIPIDPQPTFSQE